MTKDANSHSWCLPKLREGVLCSNPFTYPNWKNKKLKNPAIMYLFFNSNLKTILCFHRVRTKNFIICMETQKTLNHQSNIEKEKQSWRKQASCLETILQSYSNQDSMVLAQKQKYRSMEEDRKPRDKPRHLWSPNLWQRRQEYTMEKRQSLQ